MANGTLAASQIEMLSQSGTGIMTIVPPATNTNRTLTLPDVTGTVATLGTSLTLATAVTASGTSVDFTGIPSWVKRITVSFIGVSTNGTSFKLIQLGDSGGIETTGYSSGSTVVGSSFAGTSSTAGFTMYSVTAANALHGAITLNLAVASSNTWSSTHALFVGDAAFSLYGGGTKALSSTLDRVRVTTVNGTDTFDAGTINIMYEG